LLQKKLTGSMHKAYQVSRASLRTVLVVCLLINYQTLQIPVYAVRTARLAAIDDFALLVNLLSVSTMSLDVMWISML